MEDETAKRSGGQYNTKHMPSNKEKIKTRPPTERADKAAKKAEANEKPQDANKILRTRPTRCQGS